MNDRPSTVLAMLFADIEGSTRLLRELGGVYADVLAGYRDALEASIAEGGGRTIDTQGDGHFAGFDSCEGAIAAAVATQRRLAEREWPEGVEVRARIGLHVGEVLVSGSGYVGMEIHRAARIAAAGHGGQVLVSSAVRDQVGDRLGPELALVDLGAHRFKDLGRPEVVFQLDMPGLPASFPPIRSLTGKAHNLPIQLTSFVGREADVEAVRSALGANRLVTLAAGGGTGKTRLALQVGVESIEDFPHGVYLVDLTQATEAEAVIGQLARVLRLRESATTPLAQDLVEFLEDRQMLVILDNCEHVVEAAAEVAELLLQSCARLRLLATSRETLRVPGEAVYRVSPLAVPDAAAGREGMEGTAVQLFLDRADAVRPGFTLEDPNLDAVIEICRRLEGIPLAIELAVARLRMFTARQIADRLDDQFRLLTGGSRTAPARHRTLQAVMESSYELLGDLEQKLFQRLGVFAGGFTIEAAEQVCCGREIAFGDFVDLLTRLVDISLVITIDEEGAQSRRYRLLEPIRQFSQNLLASADHATAVREAHACYFAEQVRGGGGRLPPMEQAEWLAGLEVEDANFQSALGWAREAGRADLVVELSAGLARYWYRRGRYAEATEWLPRALEVTDGVDPSDRATLLRFAAGIAADRGDLERAQSLLSEVTEIAGAVGDVVAQARSLNLQASLAWTAGSLADAVELYEAARDLMRGTDHPFATNVLVNLALVAAETGRLDTARGAARELRHEPAGDTGEPVPDLPRVLGVIALAEGDLEGAIRHLEEAEAVYRRLGLRAYLAMGLRELATARLGRGELDLAGRALDEALDLFEEMGDRLEKAAALSLSARLAMDLHDVDQAHKRLVDSLGIARAENGAVEIAMALAGWAGLCTIRGEADRAATLHGAATAMRERIGFALPPPLGAAVERDLESLEAALGSAACEAATARGARLTRDEACRLALSAPSDPETLAERP